MKALTIAAIGLSLLGISRTANANTCESLSRLSLPNTKIILAQMVPQGDFTVDNGPVRFPGEPRIVVLKNLPGFCRVAAEISPAPDSDIRIEVWMPLTAWNGKFQGVGNGGWAGRVPQPQVKVQFLQPMDYPEMARALRDGYATAGTDTGHAGSDGDASFASDHPEKLIDFGYRAVHEMTLKAKAIVNAFYGKHATRAYWNGCSTGGKQGLTEAQRFPRDYDAIVAGAPANYWTHLMAGDVWTAQATHASAASYIPDTKYGLIHRAALDACDKLDGVKDGVIENPRHCQFNPEVLLCKSGDQNDCLTAPQVEAAKKIYAGARNSRTGDQIYPGLEPGSEMQWDVMAGSPEPPIVASYFKYLVFKNPAWDFRTLNFDGDVALADKLDAAILNATNPDIGAFIAHGGKLLLYHGWSDGLIAPENTANYYNSVVRQLGREEMQDSVRLFMIPGMEHCAGGDGASQFDPASVIDNWVESGKPPDRMIASHRTGSTVDKTHPLCPYPQVAEYTGKGSANDAANFVCAAPTDRTKQ